MNYNEWFKKNWFTLVAIAIIICVVMWHQGRIQSIVDTNVENCQEKLDKCIHTVQGDLYTVDRITVGFNITGS